MLAQGSGEQSKVGQQGANNTCRCRDGHLSSATTAVPHHKCLHVTCTLITHFQAGADKQPDHGALSRASPTSFQASSRSHQARRPLAASLLAIAPSGQLDVLADSIVGRARAGELENAKWGTKREGLKLIDGMEALEQHRHLHRASAWPWSAKTTTGATGRKPQHSAAWSAVRIGQDARMRSGKEHPHAAQNATRENFLVHLSPKGQAGATLPRGWDGCSRQAGYEILSFLTFI